MTGKISILLIVIVGSILAGILPSPKSVSALVEYTGYYFISVSFFLWLAYLFKLYFIKIKSIVIRHYDGFLLCTILTVFIFCIAPPKFKVLADETNLIGTSMAMYQSKIAALPLSGINLAYQKPEYQTIVDKRPLLYPFLVSLVHCLRGYSAYNGFVVNFILAILVLFLFYLFIYDHFPRIYSFYSILIVASLPNFVIWVTSTGFETLNLFFIIFTLFQFNKVIVTKNNQHAELLFLTLVLVSQCRYESVVFVVAILFILPILLNRKSISELSIITYLTPILFIPTLWLPRTYADLPDINRLYSQFIQVSSLYNAFSISNFITNTPKNLMVLLGFDPHLGFSPIIAIFSIGGIYLLTQKLILDFPRASLELKSMWLFGFVSFGLMYLIQSSFYRGDLTIFTQNRFAMSYLPYVVLPTIVCIHNILDKQKILNSKSIYAAIFLTFHLLFFWSYGAQQLLVNVGSIPYEYNKTLSYLKSRFKNDTNLLIVCERPNLYIVHYQGSIDFKFANHNADKILTQYQKEFDHILFLQKFRYEPREPLPANQLINGYRLVHLKNIQLTQSEYLCVSELYENI